MKINEGKQRGHQDYPYDTFKEKLELNMADYFLRETNIKQKGEGYELEQLRVSWGVNLNVNL